MIPPNNFYSVTYFAIVLIGVNGIILRRIMEKDPTKRFSDRVEMYVKYRPHYPTAVLACLQEECGLTETAVIADIGSGTGILTKLFLDNGNRVYGVEPNDEMREAAESYLADYAKFVSVNGRSEATTLPDHSVEFITAGQAFHWFQWQETKAEFKRILKPNGIVALVWNERHYGDGMHLPVSSHQTEQSNLVQRAGSVFFRPDAASR